VKGLEVRNVSKTYDGFRALSQVSLEVAPGTCLAVVGPNGAGKSTLFAVIGGQTRPDRGAVLIDGDDVTRVGPTKIAARGLSRTFQVARLFPTFTVRESIVTAAQAARRRTRLTRDPMSHGGLRAESTSVLELIRMSDDADRRVAGLTQGERKRLEFGMAIIQQPRVLVLDEPTAGMSREDVELAMTVLRETRQSRDQLIIVLSSHDMDVVFGLADLMVVMAQGRVLVQGDPAQIASDQRVSDIYLGRK
jgi:branched-chain amino acid transport system ATP-binding protein